MFFARKNLHAVRAANRFGAVVSKVYAILDRRDEYGGPTVTSKDCPAGIKVTLGIAHAAMLLMRSIASLIIQSGVSLAPMIPTFSLPRSQSSLRSSTFSILWQPLMKSS
jgi:hypothetical protein